MNVPAPAPAALENVENMAEVALRYQYMNEMRYLTESAGYVLYTYCEMCLFLLRERERDIVLYDVMWGIIYERNAIFHR